MFLDELRHFRDVLNGDAEPLCSLQDGIQVIAPFFEALASLRSKSNKNIGMKGLSKHNLTASCLSP